MKAFPSTNPGNRIRLNTMHGILFLRIVVELKAKTFEEYCGLDLLPTLVHPDDP